MLPHPLSCLSDMPYFECLDAVIEKFIEKSTVRGHVTPPTFLITDWRMVDILIFNCSCLIPLRKMLCCLFVPIKLGVKNNKKKKKKKRPYKLHREKTCFLQSRS